MDGATSRPRRSVYGWSMTSIDDIPQTRYARVDGLRIAYQRFGVVGGVRTVIIPGLVSNIDLAWDHETYRRAFDHMRRHLDCVHFDKRGMGLSDRFDDAPTIAERSRDIEAVMDALEWESACIVGISEGGAMARHFAGSHPDRVDAVALVGTMCDDARRARAEVLSGERWRPDDEMAVTWMAMVETWGEDARPMLEQFAPSQVDNDSFVRWTNRFNRLAVSPGSLLNQLLSISSHHRCDPGRCEQSIPTLIVHGEGDRILPIGNGRALAEQMPHATYVELPGEDHMFVASRNWREFIDPVIQLFTGRGTHDRKPSVASPPCSSPTSSIRRHAVAMRATNRGPNSSPATTGSARRVIGDSGGRVVKSTGDGVLAIWDVPSQAVAAASQLRGDIAAIGVDLRMGLHVGEIEVHPDLDISGAAVNLAARIEASAGPSEILVSSTMKDMLLGSSFVLDDRGPHELKGIDGSWTLFALA